MPSPLSIPTLTAKEVEDLDTLYRTTKDVRLRTWAQIILLAGEQQLIAPAIAKIVRTDDQTVRNCFKRWMAEGIEGLKDRPMPGSPPKITKAYKEQAVAPLPAGSDEIRELFETKQALLAAARDFFDRYNQSPEKILSVIGSKAKKFV